MSVICKSGLYYTDILLFDIAKYDSKLISILNSKLSSFDGKSYPEHVIFLLKNVPCQAVVNVLFLETINKN